MSDEPDSPGGRDAALVAAQAKEWVDRVNAGAGPSGGWRLQLMRFRTRRRFGRPDGADPVPSADPSVTDVNGDAVASEPASAEAGGCDDLPVRIRRFVSGCPWALVDQAVRYLHRIAPYRGIVYNGVTLEGAYRPTMTVWQRDEQSQSPGERGSLGTYTLVQDLVEVSACPDELVAPSASSCQAYEETTYAWDADSVGELPVSCEQGVTWSIRAVQRNEDGTYDYQLVKSVAKTVSWGSAAAPVLVECAKAYRVEEWGWRNLYGDPASGFLSRACGGGSASVDVPRTCSPEVGVRVEVQPQLNQDCTWNVVVRRRTSVELSDSWTDGASCRPVSHAYARNSYAKPAVPKPAPGERVSASLRRADDGTYEGDVSVVAAPQPLEFGWRDGTACRPRDVAVYKDQVSQPRAPDLGSLPAGSSLEAAVSRTDDCLWDARFAVTAPREALEESWDQGSPCRPERVTLYQDRPAMPQVPAPAAGRTVSASLRRGEDCLWDGTVSVSEASPGSVEWTEGSACRPVRAKSAFGQPSVSVPAPGAGETVTASANRNPDCTYDYSWKLREAPSGETAEWLAGSPCRPVSHRAWFDVPSRPAVSAPGVGVTVDASLRFDPEGCTWSGQESVARTVSDVRSWDEGSSCGRSRSVTMHFGVANPPSPAPGGQGQSVHARVSRNPDCTFDAEVDVETVSEADTGFIVFTSKEVTSRATYTYEYGFRAFRNARSVRRPAGTHNWTSYSVVPNDNCTYDGHMSYKDLKKVESGDGGDGGIQENDGYKYKVVRMRSDGQVVMDTSGNVLVDEYTAPLISFRGVGNEGEEAKWKVQGSVVLPGGGHLPARTYAKSVSVRLAGTSEEIRLG